MAFHNSFCIESDVYLIILNLWSLHRSKKWSPDNHKYSIVVSPTGDYLFRGFGIWTDAGWRYLGFAKNGKDVGDRYVPYDECLKLKWSLCWMLPMWVWKECENIPNSLGLVTAMAHKVYCRCLRRCLQWLAGVIADPQTHCATILICWHQRLTGVSGVPRNTASEFIYKCVVHPVLTMLR